MDDAGFIDRCQLWAKLWNLIPQEVEPEARRYISAPEAAYWDLVSKAQDACVRSLGELQECRDQLADAQRQLADLTLATLTISHYG